MKPARWGIVFLIGVLIAGGLVVWQREREFAETRDELASQKRSVSRLLAAESTDLMDTDPDLAALLAVRAYQVSATGEADTALRDAAALPLRRRLAGHHDAVLSLAFSADGNSLASAGGSADDTRAVKVWDTRTGRLRRNLPYHPETLVRALQFTPDGRTLAIGYADGTLRLWDTATGRPRTTLTFRVPRPTAAAFSPDARTYAAAGEDRTVRLWDTSTGRLRTAFDYPTDDLVQELRFSPDGRTLATTSNDRRTVRLWRDGRLRLTLTAAEDAATTTAFSPDGRTLAVGGQLRSIGLWDTATGRSRATLTGEEADAVAFSPDGRTLASGGQSGAVRLWDVASRAPRAVYPGHAGPLTALVFGPDGRSLASGSDDCAVRLWDVPVGRVVRVGQVPVTALEFAADGRVVATTGDDGIVRNWDVVSGKRLGGTRVVGRTGVVVSPDGRARAVVKDGMVRLPSGGRTYELVTMMMLPDDAHLVFSPDSRTLAVNDGGVVWMWDTDTGEKQLSRNDGLGTIAGQEGNVTALGFSPDGRTLLTASDDRAARLWDVATGRLRTTLTGHTGPLTAIASSRDGRTVATAGADGTVRLWGVDAPGGDAAVGKVCRSVGRGFSAEERAKYSGEVCSRG
ncbi:WD40 repeat domain-containing protein [Streptomyces sp. 4F14]|uniref:WD40 repeat domain-containing protein n=1 Tax=Streptomyces sp. 4F14 TaxID=3394380 RepID=UPI003A85CC6C